MFSLAAGEQGDQAALVFQLDARHRPCNLVELMPRLREHMKAA